jgi:membrane-associated PAP2 superfamily phosphatase
MGSALVLIAIAVVSGVAMGVMRARGTLALPIPVFWIHAGMVLGALVILVLKAH